MKNNKDTGKIQFYVPTTLYNDFTKLQLEFLEQTDYQEAKTLKKFFAIIISEWKEFLIKKGKWKGTIPPEEIINKRGKRAKTNTEENEYTKFKFTYEKDIKQTWDNIVYSIMYEEDFSNKSIYASGYFFSLCIDFTKQNWISITTKYATKHLNNIELKSNDSVKLLIIGNKTLNRINGQIHNIESTPTGILISIKKELF